MKKGRTGDSRVVMNSLGTWRGHDLSCHWGPIWVRGPATVGAYYHQRPGMHPWSELLLAGTEELTLDMEMQVNWPRGCVRDGLSFLSARQWHR